MDELILTRVADIRRGAVKAAVVHKYRRTTQENNVRMSIQTGTFELLEEEEKEHE